MCTIFRFEYFSVTHFTLKPDGANGTSKFIEIGGRVHFFFVSVSNNSISADNCVSFIPAIRLILIFKLNFIDYNLVSLFWNARLRFVMINTYFQTIAFSEALYFALPFRQINCTPDVFNGVGIFTSIF